MRMWLLFPLLLGIALAGRPFEFRTDSLGTFISSGDIKGATPLPLLDSLYYYNPDQVGAEGLGLTSGGLLHWAVRFTIDSAHAGKLLESGVYIYIDTCGPMPEPGSMNVYSGTANNPGTPLGAGYTFGPVQIDSWQVYDCSSENIWLTPGMELWVWAQQTHDPGQFPAAADTGVCIPNYGCWVSLDGVNWESLDYCGMFGNFNIYAIVDVTDVQEGPASDKPYLSFSTLNCGRAMIEYYLPEGLDVSLRVYDSQGRLRMILKEGLVRAGRYTAFVSGLSSGAYTVSLTAGEFCISKSLLMTR